MPIRSLFSVAIVMMSSLWMMSAQDAPYPPDNYQERNQPLMSPEELDSLVAPIALYADPQMAQVLAASTYPIEVVQAHRWLQAHPGLRDFDLTDAAAQQNWDPSVQALVPFASVLEMMDRNLDWTTRLGNAFLAQQDDVMDAVQRQRARAHESGRLVSDEQQRVIVQRYDDQPYYEIEPARTDVIYVPVYDPYYIWGPSYAPYYRNFWYPPRRPGVGLYVGGGSFGFYFGTSVGSYYRGVNSWDSWGWRPAWRQHTVIVNNNFYVSNHYRAPVRYDNRSVQYRGNSELRNRPENAWVHDTSRRVRPAEIRNRPESVYRAEPERSPGSHPDRGPMDRNRPQIDRPSRPQVERVPAQERQPEVRPQQERRQERPQQERGPQNTRRPEPAARPERPSGGSERQQAPASERRGAPSERERGHGGKPTDK